MSFYTAFEEEVDAIKILITGATGFIGTRLGYCLNEAGHALVALSRDRASAQSRLPQLKDAFPWEPLASAPSSDAFEGVDAVIHLAGESLAGRWTAGKKRAIRESRVWGTHHLVEGIVRLKSRPKVLISASAIGYYGDRGEETLTEDSAPGAGFLAEVCRTWEEEASKAQTLGLRVVRLRIGIVLGPDGGALQAILPLAKLGLGGPLGSGRQWWSWVHRDDLIGLIVHALENEVNGPMNATAPVPVRQGEFARTLGQILKRPAFLPTPSFALQLAAGEFSSELLSSKRVLPQRAQQIGYRFRFPELEMALRNVLG